MDLMHINEPGINLMPRHKYCAYCSQCHVFSGGSPLPKKKGRLTRSKKQTSRKTRRTTTDDGEKEKREEEDRKKKAVPKQTSEEKEDELNKTQSDEEMAQACEHAEQEVRNVQTVHFTE